MPSDVKAHREVARWLLYAAVTTQLPRLREVTVVGPDEKLKRYTEVYDLDLDSGSLKNGPTLNYIARA